MAKSLVLSNKTALQNSNTSLAIKPEESLISDYLEKYATIAGRAVTPQLIDIFVEALSDMPLNRIRQGLERYLKEGDRFPWPSSIRDLGEL